MESEQAKQRSRNWAFTFNNYTQAHKDVFDEVPCSYIIYGEEVGEQGTPHLQGTIIFETVKSFKQVKTALIFQSVHVEICRDVFKSIAYCKKEGKFTERGEAPLTPKEKGQKEKERWADILYFAQMGQLHKIDPKIQVTHARSLDFIAKQALNARVLNDTEMKHVWCCGKTGTGKSRDVREKYKGMAYFKIAANKWWDGYRDQQVAIIEDLDKTHDYQAYNLKLWADRYPFPAEVKGAQVMIRPDLIVVTSNYHPKDIWTKEEDLGPILRRFKVVLYGTDEALWPPEYFETYKRNGYQLPTLKARTIKLQEENLIDLTREEAIVIDDESDDESSFGDVDDEESIATQETLKLDGPKPNGEVYDKWRSQNNTVDLTKDFVPPTPPAAPKKKRRATEDVTFGTQIE